MSESKLKLVHRLRRYRRIHRFIGIVIAVLLLISAITGILLAFKKDVDIIQPPTQKGISKVLADWKPIDEIRDVAVAHLTEHVSNGDQIEIDRIDVRPSKGIAKVIFTEDSWEIQVDGVSGKVLSMSKRHSDWIESIHDGSIISDGFKLISMNFLGWGVLLLIFSGAWLYYGPGIYRRIKRSRRIEDQS